MRPGGAHETAIVVKGKDMRQMVSEAWLRDEIEAHMSNPAWDPKTFSARPQRCARKGAGANWKYSFNPGAVPKGFVDRWQEIRAKFEGAFDIADEQRRW